MCNCHDSRDLRLTFPGCRVQQAAGSKQRAQQPGGAGEQVLERPGAARNGAVHGAVQSAFSYFHFIFAVAQQLMLTTFNFLEGRGIGMSDTE